MRFHLTFLQCHSILVSGSVDGALLDDVAALPPLIELPLAEL